MLPFPARMRTLGKVVWMGTLLQLAASGCSKLGNAVGDQECKPACARAARLETAKFKQDQFALVHEMDERIEATEDYGKDLLAEYKKEESGLRSVDSAELKSLPPARRAAILEARRNRLREEERQRALAVAAAQGQIKSVAAEVAERKSQSDALIAKAVAESEAKCMTTCLARPRTYAKCLLRTQAVEDIAVCAQ